MNQHSEMILKQAKRNTAETASRYAQSKPSNTVEMRSTALNVTRENVQNVLATNAGLDRKSNQLRSLAQHNALGTPSLTHNAEPCSVKNAMKLGKNGMDGWCIRELYEY